MDNVKAQVQEHLNTPTEIDKEKQSADDGRRLQEVMSGRREFYYPAFGTIAFEYPNTGIVINADRMVAEFKSAQLKKGKLLTKDQMKAIYRQPVFIEEDGKRIKVSDGLWTVENDNRLEELPREITTKQRLFNEYRDEYQQLKTEQLGEVEEAVKQDYEERLLRRENEAAEVYKELLELNQELIELQSKHLELFSNSLEEQANFERIKYYAPRCVRYMKDGKEDFLWKSDQDLLDARFNSTEVLSLFSLFVRGTDISFFVAALGDQN